MTGSGNRPQKVLAQPAERPAAVTRATREADADQELARRREMERSILAYEGAGIGTWETFRDGHAAWDEQTYRLYGYPPDTTLPPAEIYRAAVGEEGFKRTSHWLIQAFKERLESNLEFQIRWPNGEIRWLAAKARQLVDQEGVARSLLGINWDITEQRRSHDALRIHQRELSRLALELMQQEQKTTRKLAMVLHDRLGQTLTAMRLSLDAAPPAQGEDAAWRQRLDGLVDGAIADVRNLLEDLRPSMLEDQGLGPALDNEIAHMNSASQATAFTFSAAPPLMTGRWPRDVEYTFFMIARECLANAQRHARARLVQVRLSGSPGELLLEVLDDGQGFAATSAKARSGHLGLIGMRERALAIKAALTLASSPSDGTRVSLLWKAQP